MPGPADRSRPSGESLEFGTHRPIVLDMAPEPGRKARRRRWAGVALVAAVLVAGLAVAAGGAVAVGRVEQRYAAGLMDRYIDDIGGAVTDQVERYRTPSPTWPCPSVPSRTSAPRTSPRSPPG